ncbi:response regulator [Paenibacillus abyssi]|uniref:AraC family transcriptional regulator n=1 Tax=Paenibacillus abyssi TaxID=1340531 RepID=A0A917D1H7_9BACL|nr:response regulator [Paenibacillus abyssi]GGG06077.1 AraC family transcriptional regulator [Paenibacillus abyssi]
MYRLLIVDDEMIIANGIKSSVEWGELGIVSVTAVYNLRQAKAAFEKQPIDIMITDIEMPNGDGFELFEWVREFHPQTECIFLTCHADFQYAKKAIQMGSLEYLLKPVPAEELTSVVMKATGKIGRKRESLSISEAYKHYHKLWEMHQPLFIERFWLDVLHQSIPSRLDSMMEVIRKRNIPYTGSMQFRPVLIHIQYWQKELTAREEKLMEYALRNVLDELLIQCGSTTQVVQVKEGLLVIRAIEDLSAEDSEEARKTLQQQCEALVECCNRYFYCHLSCYIGKTVPIQEMLKTFQALAAFHKNNVNLINRVVFVEECSKKQCKAQLPLLHVWSEMLKNGDKDRLFSETRQFLDAWKHDEGLDAGRLQQFYKQFIQMILYTLQQRGLRADEIYPEHLSPERTLSATRTVLDLENWVREVLEQAIVHIHRLESNETVVSRIKRYIALNIDQELSRQYIADHVGLSPDYIVKLFKKETGLSISDYIIQERMNRAKDFLLKTELPISSIALAVGFSNFAYFSTIFKKSLSMTPQDFRKNRDNIAHKGISKSE